MDNQLSQFDLFGESPDDLTALYNAITNNEPTTIPDSVRSSNPPPSIQASQLVSPGFQPSSDPHSGYTLAEPIVFDLTPSQRNEERAEARRARVYWLFTIFSKHNTDWMPIPPFRSDICRYMVVGREVCPTTGRKHLQGYLALKPGMKHDMNWLKKNMFPPEYRHAHWSRARGSPSDNIEYCTKEGNFVEFGIRPDAKQGSRSDIKALEERVRAHTLSPDQCAQEFTHFFCNGYYWKLLAQYSKPREHVANVIYIYSSTGYGKTTTVKKVCKALGKTFFIKMPGCQWFDGYYNHDVILFDEYKSSYPVTHFNAWCDGDPPNFQVKGSTVCGVSSFFIICSNLRLEEQYESCRGEPRKAEIVEAFKRRVTWYLDLNELFPQPIENIREFLYNTLYRMMMYPVYSDDWEGPNVQNIWKIRSPKSFLGDPSVGPTANLGLLGLTPIISLQMAKMLEDYCDEECYSKFVFTVLAESSLPLCERCAGRSSGLTHSQPLSPANTLLPTPDLYGSYSGTQLCSPFTSDQVENWTNNDPYMSSLSQSPLSELGIDF